jgi:peptidyl-prolyl cis-trans isomerase A (cyclophilin A)
MRKAIWIALAAATALVLAGCSSSSNETRSERAPDRAPDKFTVNLDTSKGQVTIEVYRDWAPVGVDHFHQLLKAGFYDGARFFRIVPGFVVQFGIAADPQVTARWKTPILDELVRQHNLRGTLTYAKMDIPNSRTTQMFINLGDNSRSLDTKGFAPVGLVVQGMEIVDGLYPGYGESPDQSSIERQGNVYLQGQFPLLDFIRKAAIQ